MFICVLYSLWKRCTYKYMYMTFSINVKFQKLFTFYLSSLLVLLQYKNENKSCIFYIDGNKIMNMIFVN